MIASRTARAWRSKRRKPRRCKRRVARAFSRIEVLGDAHAPTMPSRWRSSGMRAMPARTAAPRPSAWSGAPNRQRGRLCGARRAGDESAASAAWPLPETPAMPTISPRAPRATTRSRPARPCSRRDVDTCRGRAPGARRAAARGGLRAPRGRPSGRRGARGRRRRRARPATFGRRAAPRRGRRPP